MNDGFLTCAGALVVALALWASPTASAEPVDRLAAVVNDEAVTARDIETRARLVMLSSGLQDSPEIRRRMMPQVVRRLIDERLQLQEAEKLKITVTDNDIAQGIATIEQRGKMGPGGFEKLLRANGIDMAAGRQQVRAEIAWIKVVRRKLLPNVKVSEEEIDAKLETVRGNLGQPEFLAAEIVLPVEQPDQEDEVKTLLERLVEQLRGGTSFSSLAQQFSQSATAANGGDLGWVAPAMLDPDIAKALGGIEVGQVAAVRSSAGWHIVALREKRIAGQGRDASGVMLDLAQIVLPLPRDLPQEEALRRVGELKAQTRAVKNCDEMETLGKNLRLSQSGRLGKVKAGDLPDHLREVVLKLGEKSPSEPVPVPGGAAILMVCKRDTPDAALPSREAVRARIEEERLDIQARRYLRDLRRAAFIELRM
ncbi:MAG: peptidylprolyl isomerase [Alphaproteobacteria bacterium]|nr:peptidylprolyl isomerase [Alphaproteobacteria bacterium]